MTFPFDSDSSFHSSESESLSARSRPDPNQSVGALDMLKRDRFELLSAYLDGEVTASERQQVETWLANDPTVQQLYARLLKLRQGLQSMPIPATAPAQDLADAVFARMEKRSNRKVVTLWGGGAAAAALIAALGGMISGNGIFSPQMAQSPVPASNSATVTIALDRPLLDVEIPKVPVQDSETPASQKTLLKPQSNQN